MHNNYMKVSLTFILSVLIIFVSSCTTTAGNKKNFEDGNNRSKDFVLNQINKSANKDIPNIVSKLYKLKKLDKSEQDLLIVSLKNGDIKRSYTNEVEKLLNHSQEIYSSDLKLGIRTSEKNKEMLVESLLQENILFSISFSENDFFINDDVFASNLKFYCQSFIEEQNNKLENRLLREEKILIVFSSEYEEDANALMLNNSDHIYLRINGDDYENKLQKILEINKSYNKAELLSSFDKSLKIEHTPRLRQDLKKIYFLVGYNEGKSVVPFVKSFSTDLQLFSSTRIFHEADSLNDLADFENLTIPVSKSFIDKAKKNNFDNLKKKFENLLLEDYINIEKAYQNNIFNSKIILNTGLTQINRGACVERNLGFWNIDINSIAGQS
ncbi:MAG: hypothetical protein ACJ0FD_03385 [Gammaproteobacteria bacterium]